MVVHAFEYLRSVARTRRGGDLEAAAGFVQMVAHGALDGPDLLVAARRMIERRPDSVPLWWSAARLVMASDPRQLAVQILDLWDRDDLDVDSLSVDDLDVDELGDDALDGADSDAGAVDSGFSSVRPQRVVAVAASARRFVLESGDADRMTSATLVGRRVVVDVPVSRSLDDSLLQCVLDAAPVGRWLVSEVVTGVQVTHRGVAAPHSGGLLRRSAI